MGKRSNKTEDGATCYPCKGIEWITHTTPRKLHHFLYSRKNLIVTLVMALSVYVLTSGQPEAIRRTVATFVFAAGCWIFEVFPLPITGLMIPGALTLLGVFSPTAAFTPFSHPIIFLMLGGLVLGQAITKHGLDQGIALTMLTYSKGSIDRLVFLVMLTTAFLSMWMSNTVAIAVILPVILSVLRAMPEELENLRHKMLLGLTVSTSIGGMAMVTGSTPSMMAAAFLGANLPFGFIQWAYYGVPVSLLSLVIAFLIVRQLYPSPNTTLNLDAIIQQKQQRGKMTHAQMKVLLVFAGTILLWFMGSQIEVWLGLPASISSAAMVSILAVLTMFGLELLDLNDLKAIQWELMFLVGGGILLGEAMIASGAAERISTTIASLQGATPTALVLVFSLIALVLTNFISNSATAAMLLPIAIDTAKTLGVTPVPFVMAIALSATIAFITPIGVPSTAMTYATGLISRGTLIKTGILVAIPTLLITLLGVWILPIP